jgi:hypothetical protein
MSVETESEKERKSDADDPTPNSVILTAGVCSLLIGALVAYATMNLGIYGMAGAFVVSVAASVYYLSQKDLPIEVAGSASYAAGGVLLLAPSVLYFSNLLTGRVGEVLLFPEDVELEEIESVSEMLFGADGPRLKTAIEGDVGAVVPLVAWTVAFMLVALVLFVVGAVLSNRGSKRRRWKEARERD